MIPIGDDNSARRSPPLVTYVLIAINILVFFLEMAGGETFVMNWSGDLYGDVMRVRFLHRLRDEKTFSSVEELKSQIDRDVARAHRYFERAGVKKSLAIV